MSAGACPRRIPPITCRIRLKQRRLVVLYGVQNMAGANVLVESVTVGGTGKLK